MDANLKRECQDEISAGEVARAIDRLEKRVFEKYKKVKHVFIEAESLPQKAEELAPAT